MRVIVSELSHAHVCRRVRSYVYTRLFDSPLRSSTRFVSADVLFNAREGSRGVHVLIESAVHHVLPLHFCPAAFVLITRRTDSLYGCTGTQRPTPGARADRRQMELKAP